MKRELCCECDCETDKAGRADDSIYTPDGYGPLCEECSNGAALDKWRNANATLRARVEELERAASADRCDTEYPEGGCCNTELVDGGDGVGMWCPKCRADDRIAELLAACSAKDEALALCVEALSSYTDDDACSFDHHGYCQTHGVTNPCRNEQANRALLRARGTT